MVCGRICFPQAQIIGSHCMIIVVGYLLHRNKRVLRDGGENTPTLRKWGEGKGARKRGRG